MIALILALNVILDPLVTSCNVLANGALCRTFERVWHFAQAVTGKPQPSEVKI
jgi:Na+/H+-dicarboxylate symporter